MTPGHFLKCCMGIIIIIIIIFFILFIICKKQSLKLTLILFKLKLEGSMRKFGILVVTKNSFRGVFKTQT